MDVGMSENRGLILTTGSSSVVGAHCGLTDVPTSGGAMAGTTWAQGRRKVWKSEGASII